MPYGVFIDVAPYVCLSARAYLCRYPTWDSNTDAGDPKYELTDQQGGLYGPKVADANCTEHFLTSAPCIMTKRFNDYFNGKVRYLRLVTGGNATPLPVIDIACAQLLLLVASSPDENTCRCLKLWTSTIQMCCILIWHDNLKNSSQLISDHFQV